MCISPFFSGEIRAAMSEGTGSISSGSNPLLVTFWLTNLSLLTMWMMASMETTEWIFVNETKKTFWQNLRQFLLGSSHSYCVVWPRPWSTWNISSCNTKTYHEKKQSLKNDTSDSCVVWFREIIKKPKTTNYLQAVGLLKRQIIL